MSARNDICFTRPHWKSIAAGHKVETLYEESKWQPDGDIDSPRRYRMRTGQYHYRFVSSLWPDSAKRGGGWWIEYPTLRVVRAYARQANLDFRYAARLLLAVPEERNRPDRLLKACLVAPLDAYAGRGHRVETKASGAWTPPPEIWVGGRLESVRQLYVPGLSLAR